MPSFALIGYGNRGMTYAAILKEMGEKLLAICDGNKEKLQTAAALYNLSPDALYTDEDAFSPKASLPTSLLLLPGTDFISPKRPARWRPATT